MNKNKTTDQNQKGFLFEYVYWIYSPKRNMGAEWRGVYPDLIFVEKKRQREEYKRKHT